VALYGQVNPSPREDVDDEEILLNYGETSMTNDEDNVMTADEGNNDASHADDERNSSGDLGVEIKVQNSKIFSNDDYEIGNSNYDSRGMSKPSPRRRDRKNRRDKENPSNDEVKINTVKAMEEMSEGDFPLPDVSIRGKQSTLLCKWNEMSASKKSRIQIVLVTQCSLDRLPNLAKQLIRWGGKSSVALYLKPNECTPDIRDKIINLVTSLRIAAKKAHGERGFDIALRLVEGWSDGESYPINYLRNVALLEARQQQLRFKPTLDESAVLLVDVDFRPSFNLFAMLHSQYAADSVMENRRVIVCPAFECMEESTCPDSISGLKGLVDKRRAEGFHLSSFPQGHEPTQFEKFWDKSLQRNDDENEDQYIEFLWQESYGIDYEDLFEPYIVMASADVPLYDERFQGYGLNKISHLASVSKLKDGIFFVLPGVFLVAPVHGRSDEWTKIYGKSQPEETELNQVKLKGLYYNFKTRLENGQEPVVSNDTQLKKQQILGKQARNKIVTKVLSLLKSLLPSKDSKN